MAALFKKDKKTSLTEEEIQHLTTYTKLTREEVEEHFVNFLENHPNGKISKSKFRELSQSAFPTVDSTKLCDHIFKVYDTNNDGTIGFDEFLTFLYLSSSGTPEENLLLIFKIFDTNKDGHISRKELKKIIRDFYGLLGDTDVEKVKDKKSMTDEFMKEMDSDNDGVITEEEFMNSIMKSKVAKILTVRILECFVTA